MDAFYMHIKVMSILVLTALHVFTAADDVINDDFLYDTFDEGFMWGTATASYQTEGAWNESGKGLGIWDTYTHIIPPKIADNSNGDVACDSYHKYKEDVALLKDLGVNHYRFSIAWARVFPDGTKESYNQAGMDFYKDLARELKSNGIEPMVTLYHWDLPQALQDVGGWTNETIVDHFNDYADKCFEQLGDEVSLWLTFNDPFLFTWWGYGMAEHAPGISDPGVSPYKAAHNVLKSHAKAWHTYDDKFRVKQKGKISITLDSDWKGPRDPNNLDDVAASERAMQFKLGWFAHPIYVGDYPKIMREVVANKSAQQGLDESRLPTFTQEEIDSIKGTYDFFGLNHYTTQLVRTNLKPIDNQSYENDQDIEEWIDPKWPGSGSSWLKLVPWGLRKVLVWIKNNYGNPPLYITENGMSDRNGTLDDHHRIYFYKNYINNVLKASKKDGCDIKGYTAWSLLDNFEWTSGYLEKFGIHYVDFSDPARPRKPKKSAGYLKQLFRDNGFPKPTNSSPSLLTILTSTLAIVLSICYIAYKATNY